MKASDIMKREIVTVSNETVGEALDLMKEMKIRQLPVVNEQGEVIGVLSPRKILSKSLPRYITEGLLDDVSYAPDISSYLESFKGLTSKSVREVMDTEFVKVSPDTPTMEIATIFTRLSVDSVVVADDDNRLAGLISPVDVVFQLCEYAKAVSE